HVASHGLGVVPDPVIGGAIHGETNLSGATRLGGRGGGLIPPARSGSLGRVHRHPASIWGTIFKHQQELEAMAVLAATLFFRRTQKTVESAFVPASGSLDRVVEPLRLAARTIPALLD